MVADDMRPNIGAYQDINSPIYSSPPMHTPNIDALASSVNIISVQQELIIYLCRACYSPEHMLSKPSAPLAEHPCSRAEGRTPQGDYTKPDTNFNTNFQGY